MMKIHPHPGTPLVDDVLQQLGLEVTETARRLGVARTTLSRVLNGHSGISPGLANRLELAGGSSARFWMTLQTNYELWKAQQLEPPQVERLQTEAA